MVFVPGVLAGEQVAVRLVSAKRDFARAELVEVLEPSPERVEAACAARRRGCGGCDWQHVRPSHQVAAKLELVREALRRTARLVDVELDVGGSVPPWAYRTSMRLAVDRHGAVSLRRARTNEAVVLDHCPIAHPLLDELVHSARFRGADEVSLRVGISSGERSAWWTRAHPGDAVEVEGLAADVRTGPDAVVHEEVAGHRFRVSAESFFQSGPAAAELLVDTVREFGGGELATASHLVDAYGGVGLFAVALAPAGSRVTLVEGSAAAVADARVNLAGRPDVAADVVATAVERWAPAANQRPDVIVADPSRQGLGAAVDVLAGAGASVLVLVGCDPVAFARDAGRLAASGYRLERGRVLDLFPHTHHVEVVGRFERTNDVS